MAKIINETFSAAGAQPRAGTIQIMLLIHSIQLGAVRAHPLYILAGVESMMQRYDTEVDKV